VIGTKVTGFDTHTAMSPLTRLTFNSDVKMNVRSIFIPGVGSMPMNVPMAAPSAIECGVNL